MKKEIKEKFKYLSNMVGNTPLVEICCEYKGKKRNIYAKLEWYNLTGSIKDRPALEILKSAYARGDLKRGQTICETTSGNMGISISAIASFIGNPVVICMPRTMSRERQEMLKLFGAKLELTEDFDEAFARAEEYKSRGAYLPHQFENLDNEKAHYSSTANEILEKLKNVDCFVSGVGTGGTLMGVGKHLKEQLGAKIIAIDPIEASLLKTGKPQGKHKIQGLSDGRIPALYTKDYVDEILSINSDDAIAMAQKLCGELGLSVGISSGANFLGCLLSNKKTAVTVFADDNKKYLSTELTEPKSSKLVDEIKLISYKAVISKH